MNMGWGLEKASLEEATMKLRSHMRRLAGWEGGRFGQGRLRKVCPGGWNNSCREPKLRESTMSLGTRGSPLLLGCRAGGGKSEAAGKDTVGQVLGRRGNDAYSSPLPASPATSFPRGFPFFLQMLSSF